jgi:hypothetical protein
MQTEIKLPLKRLNLNYCEAYRISFVICSSLKVVVEVLGTVEVLGCTKKSKSKLTILCIKKNKVIEL